MSDASTRALQQRIQGMVARGTLAKSNADPQMQELQIELLVDETHDGAEHFESYGLTARPKAGAEVVALFPGGTRSHAIVLAVGDRRYRLKGLLEGEVALYDDQGQKVLIGREGIVISSALGVSIETDGDIAMTAQGDVSIESTNFTVTTTGQQQLLGDDIEIGNGATKGAAREDDAIDDSADKITGHSGKVKIG